jgi:hypothetical protein
MRMRTGKRRSAAVIRSRGLPGTSRVPCSFLQTIRAASFVMSNSDRRQVPTGAGLRAPASTEALRDLTYRHQKAANILGLEIVNQPISTT